MPCHLVSANGPCLTQHRKGTVCKKEDCSNKTSAGGGTCEARRSGEGNSSRGNLTQSPGNFLKQFDPSPPAFSSRRAPTSWEILDPLLNPPKPFIEICYSGNETGWNLSADKNVKTKEPINLNGGIFSPLTL